MKVPHYFEYELTSYACVPGSLGIDEARAKAVVIVRQIPYPAYEAWTYKLNILSYEYQ